MPLYVLDVKMESQMMTRGFGLFVDLNCGWYCHIAVLNFHIDKSSNAGTFKPKDLVKRARSGYGYSPVSDASCRGMSKGSDCSGWEQMLKTHGPFMASGKLGGADWGALGGVGHWIVIVGTDTASNVLFYKDPLQGNKIKQGTFAHMNPRIDDIVYYVPHKDAIEASRTGSTTIDRRPVRT